MIITKALTFHCLRYIIKNTNLKCTILREIEPMDEDFSLPCKELRIREATSQSFHFNGSVFTLEEMKAKFSLDEEEVGWLVNLKSGKFLTLIDCNTSSGGQISKVENEF